MALTPLQVNDVCYGQASSKNPYGWGGNNTCKFLLSEFTSTKMVHMCMKQAQGKFDELKARGSLQGKGDNCPGYRFMRHADQGYDLDTKKP